LSNWLLPMRASGAKVEMLKTISWKAMRRAKGLEGMIFKLEWISLSQRQVQ
jgi:hypothetical protein